MKTSTGKFAEALECIESMPIEDQSALIDVVNKRIAAARRKEIISEVAEARADYSAGKVRRGSSATLMRELRGK